MSEEKQQTSPTAEGKPLAVIPKCPHCWAGSPGSAWPSGAPIVMTHLQMGNIMTVVFACGNQACGAIHSVQLLEVRHQAEQKSAIVQPSGLV